MNLANKLTLSRIAIIPVFLLFLAPGDFWIPERFTAFSRLLALLVFIGASITDYYDGMLARRYGWVTNFGKLMDPLADKVLVMAAFVGLVQLRIFPGWMVVIVLGREFLITGLRLLAATQGRVLGADRWGKNKTISQLTTIITALVYLVARDWLALYGLWDRVIVRQWDLAWALTLVLHVMMLICVFLTIASGWRYFAQNWDVFRDS